MKTIKTFYLGFGLLIAGLLAMVPYACTKKREVSVQVPVITHVNKQSLAIGDTLVISGSLFSPDVSVDQVAIANTSLKVVAASATQLSAVVQPGTSTGQLTVALSAGRAASYPDSIVIVGGVRPFITSVTPAIAYSGDTVVIRGGNFSAPVTTTGVSISASTCKIVDIADSMIKLIVPDAAYTGPTVVTCRGVSSLPFPFTVQKVNPLEDGRLYWINPVEAEVNFSYQDLGAIVSRGRDSATAPPYSTVVYTDNLPEFPNPNTSLYFPTFFPASPVVKDAQGNAYYLSFQNSTDPGDNSTNTIFSLVKLALTSTGVVRSNIWQSPNYNSNTYPYTLWYYDPTDSVDDAYPYPNNPQLVISIDGNTAYIKLGITDSFYTGDLSQANPVLTARHINLVNDSISQVVQFGANYIFYQLLTLTGVSVKYQQRGSNVSQTIPLDPSLYVLSTMADPSHGDNILILCQSTSGSNVYGSIYKFNAPTQTLTKLYDQTNWKDAVNFRFSNGYDGLESGGSSTTNGILWAGSHIYYGNCSKNYVSTTLSLNGGAYAFNGLYRLNDDGSSTRAYNVYPRLEPPTLSPASDYLYLFNGKQ